MQRMDVDPPSPALCLDIFSLIMFLCNKPTISNLMRTCSTLYSHGVRRLLDGLVVVRSEEQAVSFCLFMAKDPRARCPFLRQLHLAVGIISTATGRLLWQECLQSMTALEKLEFSTADDTLDSWPQLAGAIAELTTLKHLDIRGARTRACRMVRGLRKSKLVTAEFSYDPEEISKYLDPEYLKGLDSKEVMEHQPVRLFAASAKTLESLKTDYSIFRRRCSQARPKVTYPRVHTLKLMDAIVNTRPWIEAFPALRNISNAISWDIEDADDELRRLENAEQQMAHGSWESLEECSGSIYGIWILGLICPVQKLRLFGMNARWHPAMLGEM
ncbi:hypothetical protein BD414DRAFT_242251 [Trametes punicea]|nr:hypothetical protein BD414DRAFT_242251 [Trametes punicea]